MIFGVTSGWNCTPMLRPITYACGPTSLSAITVAPGGAVNVSKCHWNHGPSGTSSGSVVRTGSQPISETPARNASPPSSRASSWPPKQMPSTETSASTALRSSTRSRGIHEMWSWNAANSEPSGMIRSYCDGSTSRSSTSMRSSSTSALCESSQS